MGGVNVSFKSNLFMIMVLDRVECKTDLCHLVACERERLFPKSRFSHL